MLSTLKVTDLIIICPVLPFNNNHSLLLYYRISTQCNTCLVFGVIGGFI